jgi:tetratricopeptide (TPR) repeat protein
MPSFDWLEWLSKYWPVLGGLLTLLLGGGSLWLKVREERRASREERAKRIRLISEADILIEKAKRQDNRSEEMILEAVKKYMEATEYRQSRREKANLYWRIGGAYALIGWWDKAEEAYREAVRYHRKHPRAWRDLAETQRGLPQKEKERESIESLRQHLRYHPTDQEAKRLLTNWTQAVPPQPAVGGTEIPISDNT